MKNQKHLFWLLIPLIAGCVNLKIANSYADTSIKAIESYKTTGFSFKSLCLRRCEITRLSDRIMGNFKPIDKPLPCDDCKEQVKADEAISKILGGLTTYLESVQKLSDDGIGIKYDGLADALDKTDLINVDTKEINAYKNLISFASNIIVDSKRKTTLHDNIARANPPFTELTEKVIIIIDKQLVAYLNAQKEIEHDEYEVLVKVSNSMIEKINIEKAYFEKIKDLESINSRLVKYRDILKSVKDGHNELYKSGAKLDNKYLANQLYSYFNTLKKLKIEFDNLKTTKQ